MLYQRNQDELPADLEQFLEKKIDEYQQIQDYLREACQKTHFTELQIDINKFEETIELVHDRILEAIETGMKALEEEDKAKQKK